VPAVEVVYYREGGRVPMDEWLAQLRPEARDVCIAHLRLLQRKGFELRRPLADFLADDIYELRAKWRGINYRILYFFHGCQAIVGSHGLMKQRASAPESEMRRAIERMTRFKTNPAAHVSIVEL
jgi:phage-related protein